MKALGYFYTTDMKPSFESDDAKWWLCEKGKHYAVWHWQSKKDETFHLYVMTDIKTSEVVADDHLLESIDFKFTLFEKLKEEEI